MQEFADNAGVDRARFLLTSIALPTDKMLDDAVSAPGSPTTRFLIATILTPQNDLKSWELVYDPDISYWFCHQSIFGVDDLVGLEGEALAKRLLPQRVGYSGNADPLVVLGWICETVSRHMVYQCARIIGKP